MYPPPQKKTLKIKEQALNEPIFCVIYVQKYGCKVLFLGEWMKFHSGFVWYFISVGYKSKSNSHKTDYTLEPSIQN